ncbi:suppressor of cytokine signaling 7 isoform 2-T2 [Menidia menidia]
MNNAQDMSPDFVLMRLVSAAEDDRLDAENGNLPGGGVVVVPAGLGKELGKEALALDIGRDPAAVTLERPAGRLSDKARRPASGERAPAPDARPAEGPRAARTATPPPQRAVEAPGFDFAPGSGLRPQLLVFSNIMRGGDGILELDRLSQQKDAPDPGPRSGRAGPAVNNNNNAGGLRDPERLQPGGQIQQQQQGGHRQLQQLQQNRPPGPSGSVPPELQGRIQPPGSDPLTVLDSREGAVFELARRFGELGVDAVPKMLFKAGALPNCSCQGAHGSVGAGGEPGDDPAETSDALLVLEGLGSGDVEGLGGMGQDEADDEDRRHEFLLDRKREIVKKMSGAFSIGGFQVELRRQVEEADAGGGGAHLGAQVCGFHGAVPGRPPPHAGSGPSEAAVHAPAKLTTPTQSSPWATTPNPSQASTPRRRPERCASAPRTPTGRAAGGEKAFKGPGKSKKGSLKIRLSKLFRTKSCNGSSHLLDKRPSVSYSVSSAGSLVDMAGASCPEQDPDSHSQARLTRAHSAFSPASLSAFTGETVSLVDVDISRRGTNTPHPPTPPAPPRRSLSLLDAFLRALPHSNPSADDAPPPSRQAPPPVLCALRRSEASNFTASLRELEKCGWYWGPMNWEDAEMKLKGKPDGSFLVRDSSDPRYILSLSFRSQGVTHHTRMEHYRGTFSLWCHPKFEDRCHSVVEFIERAIMHSKNGKFLYFLRSRVPGLPPTPVQLLYPVSRFSNVKSLQHLCRFCIRQIVRIDHIQALPLPRSLISYLSKFYYYDPEEEMYLSIKSIQKVVGADQEAESQT